MFNNANNGGYSLADVAAVTNGNRNDGFFGNNDWWVIILFLLFGYGNGGFGYGGFGGGAGAANVGYQDALTRQAINNGFDINNIETALHNLQGSVSENFCNTNMAMLNGFANNTLALTTGIDAIQNSLKDNNIAVMQGNFALQQAINGNNIANMQNTNALTAQLNDMGYRQQDCCCQTQRLIESTAAQAAYNAATNAAQANYNLATESCAIKQNTTDNTRAAIDATNDGTRAILAAIEQLRNDAKDDKIATQAAEIAALRGQASQEAQNAFIANQVQGAINAIRPTAIPSYTVPNPNYGYYSPCGCGCGCNGNYQ